MSTVLVSSRHSGVDQGKDSVYVGRPSPWGNPFPVGSAGAGVAVKQYVAWLRAGASPAATWVRANIGQLRGKVLVCWCGEWRCGQAPSALACHAVVLWRLANRG